MTMIVTVLAVEELERIKQEKEARYQEEMEKLTREQLKLFAEAAARQWLKELKELEE
jgi:hypothetical protein